MPQADIPNETSSVELQLIDGIETLVITGKDFIKLSCDPDLPAAIVPFDIPDIKSKRI